MHRSQAALAIAACLALAVPATAGADGGLKHSLPQAGALCAKADAGTLGKLAPSSDAVKAACTTLRGRHSATRQARIATVEPLRTLVYAIVGAQRTACHQARAAHGPPAAMRKACAHGANQARARITAIRAQIAVAEAAARAGDKAARTGFWTTIKALRGGATVAPDRASSTVVPSSAAVPESDLDEG